MDYLKQDQSNFNIKITFTLLLIASTLLFLNSCGNSSDAGSSTSEATSVENGITLKGENIEVDADLSSSTLNGLYLHNDAFSFRVLAGWVSGFGSETSSGTIKLGIATGKPKTGTYKLAKEVEGDNQARVVIPKSEKLGIKSELVSTSGELKLTQLETGDKDAIMVRPKKVTGSFEGTFENEEGQTKKISGTFRYIPED